MRHFIKLVVLALLCCSSAYAADEELLIARVSLDEATKQIIEGTYNKVLGAQTEVIDGKEVHVIKVLTPDGRIQFFKIDAETGQLVNEPHA
jgi:uncharacterized membrane protein YkoI